MTLFPLSIYVSPDLTPTFFAFGIILGLLAGFIEEVGWMGFAFPIMVKKTGVLGASLILGFMHALWHLPADFLGNWREFGLPWLTYFAGFFIFVIALRVLIAWVYVHTRSLFLSQMMHASSSGFLSVLVPIGVGGLNWTFFYTIYAVVLWAAAVFLIAKFGENLHTRQQGHKMG